MWSNPSSPLYLIPLLTVSLIPFFFPISSLPPSIPSLLHTLHLSLFPFMYLGSSVHLATLHFSLFFYVYHTIHALEHSVFFSFSLSHPTVPSTPVLEDLSDLAEIASLTRKPLTFSAALRLPPDPFLSQFSDLSLSACLPPSSKLFCISSQFRLTFSCRSIFKLHEILALVSENFEVKHQTVTEFRRPFVNEIWMSPIPSNCFWAQVEVRGSLVAYSYRQPHKGRI